MCYESFTIEALCGRGGPNTFSPVMTGRKPTSRTATAGVFSSHQRAQTTIFALSQLSAQNVLFLTVNRQRPNEVRQASGQTTFLSC